MQTITVTYPNPNATQLVAAGAGPTLIANADPANTFYLGDTPATSPQTDITECVPLAPTQFVVVDGTKDVYAACLPSITANCYVLPGGMSFFQLLNQLTLGSSPNTQIQLTSSGGTGIINFLFNNPNITNGYLAAQDAGPMAGFIQLQGPALKTAGETDYVVDDWITDEGGIGAIRLIAYWDANGVEHNYFAESANGVQIAAGSITGVLPGTGTGPLNPAQGANWQNIPLVGWSVVAGYEAEYRINALGNTELSGRIQATAASATISTTLGAGYYATGVPFQSCAVPVLSNTTAITADQTPRLALSNAGILTVAGITVAVGTQLSLDGCMFPVSAG
jgi:hypothetical protein